MSRVNSLYNHYALQDEDNEVVDDTVRYPILPEHIKCDVHDVASAFKKFLAGLPGGILGKTWLFDAFVSIHHNLDVNPEWIRTRQSKVRARLIALAIASHPSRYQRELICAVLGLLCMIGRASEIAPREDLHGRPLPTSDLMGYGSIGVVFGPLLIGNLLDDYQLRGSHNALETASHNTVSRSFRGKHKKTKSVDNSLVAAHQATEKVKIANHVTEMLITHWRDVVRQMRSLGALKTMARYQHLQSEQRTAAPRPTNSQFFALRKPPEWDRDRELLYGQDANRSPTPSSGNFFIPHDRSVRECPNRICR